MREGRASVGPQPSGVQKLKECIPGIFSPVPNASGTDALEDDELTPSFVDAKKTGFLGPKKKADSS